MKVLRIILVLVALLVLLLLGIGFMGPTGMDVSHTKTMKLQRPDVMYQVNNLRNWTNWSPWYAADTTMELTYSEDSIGVGAWYSWKGDKSGTGRLEIREVQEDKIGMDIGFDMGDGLQYSTCDMIFTKVKKGTVVTWTFKSSNQTDFGSRIANVIMPSILMGQYEKGLNALAEAAEKNPVAQVKPKTLEPGMKIKDMEGFYYIGKRFFDTKIADIKPEDYASSYGMIMEYLGSMNAMDKLIQPPVSLTESYDRETTESTFVVTMKTTEKLPPTEELITDYFRSHNAMTYTHRGSYETLPESYTKIMETIRERNLTPLFPSYEMYVTDPGAEPDTTKWETLVVVPIQWTE